MMRKPTPVLEVYAHWRAALAGKAPPITHDPQPGFYRRKLVRGGPWVGVHIWLEQDIDEAGELIAPPVLRALVGSNSYVDADDVWTYVADNPISQEEYNFMVAEAAWTKARSPDDPSANPREPIDPLRAPLPF